MDDFLAREREILGADADLFSTDNPAPAIDSSAAPAFGDFTGATSNGGGGDMGGFGDFEASAFPEDPSGGFMGSALGSSDAPQMGLNSFIPPADPPVEVESDAVKAWKEQFAATIAERDARSARKHQEVLATAKDSLERFYAEYNDKKSKSIARNKENEKQLSEKREEVGKEGNVWESVVKQIDLSASSSFSNPARDAKKSKPGESGGAGKDGEKKAVKPKAKDTSRMKSLLISLKADKQAPGVKAQ